MRRSRASQLQSALVSVFPSVMGWIALAQRGGAVVQLTFGHESPEAAMQALDQGLSRDARMLGKRDPLVRRIERFLAGAVEDLSDVAVDLGPQTDFQKRVVRICRAIPFGRTLSYGEVATKAGAPRAARAVGNVMRANKIPLIIPCHRVVAAQGKLGGYSGAEGRRTKLRLLELEALAAGRSRKPRAAKRRGGPMRKPAKTNS